MPWDTLRGEKRKLPLMSPNTPFVPSLNHGLLLAGLELFSLLRVPVFHFTVMEQEGGS